MRYALDPISVAEELHIGNDIFFLVLGKPYAMITKDKICYRVHTTKDLAADKKLSKWLEDFDVRDWVIISQEALLDEMERR